jgi:general secretion pathway protein E
MTSSQSDLVVNYSNMQQWFGRLAVRKVDVDLSSPPPLPSPASGGEPEAGGHKASAVAPPSTITKFAQIPQYLRLLTAGDAPVYRLSAELQTRLVATDVGGKRVNIITAAPGRHDTPTQRQQLLWQCKALQGELRAKGYQITAELVATHEVMQHIAKNIGYSHQGLGRGEPLRLFNRWIELAVQCGATDVHVDVQGNSASVRIRVDGRLEPLPDGAGSAVGSYPRLDAVDALAAGYNNSRQGNNVSQYVEDKFVACMIALNLPGVQGHLRFQNFKGREGPKAVLRILRSGEGSAITLAQAGYAPSQLKLLHQATRCGKGIVLIAGVTSSGKSTSLKCLIENLPHLSSKAVYTVEDPIEYDITGAHQIEVLRDLADDALTTERYADTMRALMRGDPDCVMLGEIRDKLTAMFALQIAETGHLALGTVHAHLISTIVPRLTNDQIGVSRQALTGPNILNLLVYQALVPLLCPHCALSTAQAASDPEVSELAQLLAHKFKLSTQTIQHQLRWQNPHGCTQCNQRGTQGKTVVAEMLRPDRAWLSKVRQSDDDGALMHYRSHANGDPHSPDMTGKTVFEHTLYKALQGQVDVREAQEFESFERFEVRVCADTVSNTAPNQATPP